MEKLAGEPLTLEDNPVRQRRADRSPSPEGALAASWAQGKGQCREEGSSEVQQPSPSSASYVPEMSAQRGGLGEGTQTQACGKGGWCGEHC